MSQKHVEEFECPHCGHKQATTVWSTVNAQADREARQEILDQRLNSFECASCGESTFIDASLLYHDMDMRYCVQYVSKEAMGTEEYYANLTKQGTMLFDGRIVAEVVLEKGRYLFEPHFVFSTREMAAYIVFRDLCAQWGHG